MAIKGIDVSRHNGSIDFNAVKNSGVEIVIIKSSGADWTLGSDGTTFYEDSKFEEHYQRAKNAGLKIGFYHYYSPRMSASKQAEMMWNLIKNKKFDIPPCLDIEGSEASALGSVTLCEYCQSFLDKMQQLSGVEPIIYSGDYFTRDLLQPLKKYKFWIANYPNHPVSEKSGFVLCGHQYSESGSVNGVSGNVDMNEFYSNIYIQFTSKKEEEIDYKGENDMFSENYYLTRYPDVKKAVEKGVYKSAYDHYKKRGKLDKPNRQPLPPVPVEFCEGEYLELNPDVAKAVKEGKFTSGLHHYLLWGWNPNEKRKVCKSDNDEALKKRIKELEDKIEKAKKDLK